MNLASVTDLIASSNKRVVLDFTAAWCGPCKTLGPILDGVAVEYADQIELVKIDVDAHPDVAAAYSIQGIPTLIVFDGGEQVQRFTGAKSKPDVVRSLGLS